MQKDELLNHTAALPAANKAAIKLARDCLCENKIEARRALADKRVKAMKLASHIFSAVSGAVAYYLAAEAIYYGDAAQQHSDNVNMFAAVCLGGTLAWCTWVVCQLLGEALSRSFGLPMAAELLTPTAGTEHCKDGVNALVKGGPRPAMWRDIALRERSQLHVFDIRIMQTLADAEQEAAAKRAREAELEKACRVLHGVPFATK